MELVSASKLRRAQEYAARSRDYRDLAYDMLKRLNAMGEVERQPLFRKRPVKNRLYVVVTSNTGLAGAYNANVLKQLTNALQRDQSEKVKSQCHYHRRAPSSCAACMTSICWRSIPFGDQPTANEVQLILSSVMQHFSEETVDEANIIYTKFQSTIVQVAQTQQLLPAPALDNEGKEEPLSNFEPDVETVIEQITTRLIEAQIWQAVLEPGQRTCHAHAGYQERYGQRERSDQ